MIDIKDVSRYTVILYEEGVDTTYYGMEESDTGEYVEYDDYKKLWEFCKRLEDKIK